MGGREMGWGRRGRRHTLHPPVVNQADFVGQGEGDEVGDAEEGEDDGEEGEGGGLRFESAGVGLGTSKKRGVSDWWG